MATKKENLKEVKTEDMTKKLAGLREDLRSIHFKAEGSKSKNVKEGATIKKQIARLMTEMRSREIVK